LSEAVANPQFTWGNGAKARAVEVIGKVGQKKYIAWLTSLAASGDGDASVRAAAIKVLGELGAPPKKDKKSE
jgi:HEAT repeat protein